VLDGGAGVDTASGGLGDDLFYVDNTGDVVNEAAGEGAADRVITTVSYTLAAGSEIETLITNNTAGTANLNLTGNEFGNVIKGNAGANTITGGDGDDNLQGLDGADILIGGNGADEYKGGNGADTFLFNAGTFGADLIKDWQDGVDHIEFTGIAGVDDFSDLTIGNDGLGNALITLPDGSTITLRGIAEGTLDASDFVFGP